MCQRIKAMNYSGLDYIEEHLKSEIEIKELAEMSHYSLFHFYKLFPVDKVLIMFLIAFA